MPPTRWRFVNALLLGILVALLAVMVKSFLVGLDQGTPAGVGSRCIDTLSAPLLLVPDVLMQAMRGLLVGTAPGLLDHHD